MVLKILDTDYSGKVKFEEYPFELSNFQKNAIGSYYQGNHVFVAAPTGSGKTLPAEHAIQDMINKGKKVIYTSPIKTLSNQKFKEFKDKFKNADVGILTGDVKFNPTGNVINDAWNFTNDINLKSGKTYNINDVIVLSNDTLGSTVLNSSLTGVGSLSSGSISENFGDINIGTNKFTGGNLVIKSGGSDVFNINSSSGITQSIKSSLSNSTTITGFNQVQLNDSDLLNINKIP